MSSEQKSARLATASAELHATYARRKAGPSSVEISSAPGCLGNPLLNGRDDPRLDPRLKSLLPGPEDETKPENDPILALGPTPTLEAIGRVIGLMEEGGLSRFASRLEGLKLSEAEQSVTREDLNIAGGDGQDMLLHIYRPKHQTASLPAVIYSHGGAMVMFPTMNPSGDLWSRSIAANGVVVIMADYRNAYVAGKHYPFPAGLNDCAAAARYVYAHNAELKVSNVVLHGESGGANLVIATALKAKREGWLSEISGVYASVPYISNAYGWSREEQLRRLPSLIECSYSFSAPVVAYMAHYYTPEEKDQENPLAWPYFATVEELKGLPPHVVAMDELDGLRDEGVDYARKLAHAGVSVDSKINLGGIHATAHAGRKLAPEKALAQARDVAAFAKSL